MKCFLGLMAMRVCSKIVALMSLCAMLLFSASTLRADVFTYTVTTCIDGQDHLILNSSGLQWQYNSFTPVGIARSDCTTTPTSISSTLNGASILTNAVFNPVFPGGSNPVPGALSQVFVLSPTFPTSISAVSLTVLMGRESLTISQMPSTANGETLILDFNDNSTGGAALYSAKVTVTGTNAVPEPCAGFLTLIGIGSGWVARKRIALKLLSVKEFWRRGRDSNPR